MPNSARAGKTDRQGRNTAVGLGNSKHLCSQGCPRGGVGFFLVPDISYIREEKNNPYLRPICCIPADIHKESLSGSLP